jgi:colanic acid/amylovoran biosynthesis glycosyltransferase
VTLRVRVVGLAQEPEPFLAQLLDGLADRGIEVRRGDRGRADVLYLPWTATAVERPEVFRDGVPVVVSCRGAQVNVAPWNPRRAALRDGLPGAFAAATAVHCVSDAIRDEAAQHGLDPAKATVIRPAVDLGRFTRGPVVAGEPFRLISVGRLMWRKGYEYGLLAVRRLRESGADLRYEIVGEEVDGGATRHAVHDLGLTDVVTLTPPLGRDDVAQRLRASDALLLPSLSEGIANTVLEAMACARPVVTTDCGGMVEAVTDGVEGRVVPVRDPAALAEAVDGLLSDPRRATDLGEAGRRRVERDHDLADQVRTFADLFEAVAR